MSRIHTLNYLRPYNHRFRVSVCLACALLLCSMKMERSSFNCSMRCGSHSPVAGSTPSSNLFPRFREGNQLNANGAINIRGNQRQLTCRNTSPISNPDTYSDTNASAESRNQHLKQRHHPDQCYIRRPYKHCRPRNDTQQQNIMTLYYFQQAVQLFYTFQRCRRQRHPASRNAEAPKSCRDGCSAKRSSAVRDRWR